MMRRMAGLPEMAGFGGMGDDDEMPSLPMGGSPLGPSRKKLKKKRKKKRR
jgi:hypothetical protein